MNSINALWVCVFPFRLRQAGLPRPSRVFMVSALNGLGVKDMVHTLKDDMSFRGDLWVVGAQNGEQQVVGSGVAPQPWLEGRLD